MKSSLLDLPFSAGLDESQRAELQSPAEGFAVLENVRQPKKGGLTKRYGFTALALTRARVSDRSGGYKLYAKDGKPCIIDASTLDVYASGTAVNFPTGRAPVATYSISDLPSIGVTGAVEDVEYCNGYVAVVWRAAPSVGSQYVYAAVIDEASGAVVQGPILVLSASGIPLLGSYGTYFVLVTNQVGVGIKAWYLDTTSSTTIVSGGWVSLGTIAADVYGTERMSIASASGGVCVIYVNNAAGASNATVRRITAAGGVDSTTINTSTQVPDAVDCAVDSAGTLWCAWNELLDVKVCGLTASSLSTVVATTSSALISAGTAISNVTIAPNVSTSGIGRVAARDDSSPPRMHHAGYQTTAGAAVASGSSATVMNAAIVGRAFSDASNGEVRYYLPVWGGAAAQKNFILCDWTQALTYLQPIASVAPGLASYSNYGKCKTVVGASSTKRMTGLSVTRSASSDASRLVRLDFVSTQRWQAVAHGEATFLSAGVLSEFDGVRIAETGFLVRPPKPTTSMSGTGFTAASGVRYVAIYEEVDANGNWHVSGISDPSENSGAVANKTVTVVTSPLTISNRFSSAATQASSVRVAIYRTPDGGSPPYYRVGTAANALGSATVSYADTTGDSTLTANAKLYSPTLPSSVGASLDRRAPPGLLHLVSYNGMLVGSTGEDLWYSGQDVSGEATWFSPIFQIPCTGLGDITGLAVQDGTLYAFARNGVWAINGDAPSDNGASGGLGTPRRLAVDAGCVDARSIVVTSLGIFFQSARGIEILTRAQSVEWIGQPIQDTTAAYPICTSATIDHAQALVYFELASAESSNQVSGTGRSAVFDLSMKIWVSTDRRKNSAGTADTPSQSACMVYTGSAWRYAWLGTDGRVYVEDQTTHLDPGSAWVTAKVTTNWMHAAGLQGEQSIDRVMLLADRHTGHDLAVSAYFDYVDSSPETTTFTAATIAALSREWLDFGLTQSTSNALRVTMSDATPSSGSVGTGKGATWIGLAFPGLVHGGVKRTASGQRGG